MKTNSYKILLVDDEKDILDFVSYNLVKEGYDVYTALNGSTALEMAQKIKPDLIILDIMMPGIDGIEVCRQLREKETFANTLIIFLTARGEDYTEIAGFDVGADDFIPKPIRLRVLLARIKALFKRKFKGKEKENKITFGDFTVSLSNHLLFKGDEEIHLPKKEFELLVLLASNPGKVFKRNEIYLHIWGGDIIVGERTLDVHILKLREKIGKRFIKTNKGVGYRFVTD